MVFGFAPKPCGPTKNMATQSPFSNHFWAQTEPLDPLKINLLKKTLDQFQNHWVQFQAFCVFFTFRL